VGTVEGAGLGASGPLTDAAEVSIRIDHSYRVLTQLTASGPYGVRVIRI